MLAACDGFHVAGPTTAFVEAWINHLETGDVHSLGLPGMPHTPSPSKKRRVATALADMDATLRAQAGALSDASLGSESSGGLSQTTSSSRPRGLVSPKKREIELRQAADFPLHREPIENLSDPSTLMQDLVALRSRPIIPNTVKDRVTRDCGWAKPPNDAWFYSTPELGSRRDDSVDVVTFLRLDAIRRHTIKYKQRMEHEAGWNDSVHSSLLEIAFDNSQFSYVDYRNVTQCRIYSVFRDANPFLADAKIDYSVFLGPSDDSRLSRSLRHFRSQDPHHNRATHVQLSDEADTPVAIGIETKSSKADSSVIGPAQLATWARAHFRHLGGLPNANADKLPILPLIFVCGAAWRVDFAQRHQSRMTIWEGLHIGSSDELHGCYLIVAALRRLAQWSYEEFMPWWEQALGDLSQPRNSQGIDRYSKLIKGRREDGKEQGTKVPL